MHCQSRILRSTEMSQVQLNVSEQWKGCDSSFRCGNAQRMNSLCQWQSPARAGTRFVQSPGLSYGGCAETPVESEHSCQAEVTLSGRGHWITLPCLPVLLCVSFRVLMLSCRGVAWQGLSCADISPASWLYLYKRELNQCNQEWSQIYSVQFYQNQTEAVSLPDSSLSDSLGWSVMFCLDWIRAMSAWMLW